MSSDFQQRNWRLKPFEYFQMCTGKPQERETCFNSSIQLMNIPVSFIQSQYYFLLMCIWHHCDSLLWDWNWQHIKCNGSQVEHYSSWNERGFAVIETQLPCTASAVNDMLEHRTLILNTPYLNTQHLRQRQAHNGCLYRQTNNNSILHFMVFYSLQTVFTYII